MRVDRIRKTLEWNGMTILDGGWYYTHAAAAVARLSLQVGSGSGQTMMSVFKVLGS